MFSITKMSCGQGDERGGHQSITKMSCGQGDERGGHQCFP